MSLTPYVYPPITGITMASGSFTQQPIYQDVLSYQPDAQKYADAIGAKLVNAADTPATNFTFKGIKPEDAAQPWMVTWDGVQFFFAGIAIDQQIKATKAVTGMASTDWDGTWAKEPSGVWDFTPKPLTPVTPPTPDSSGDAAAWAALEGAGSLTEAQKDKLLINIAQAVGAKVPQ